MAAAVGSRVFVFSQALTSNNLSITRKGLYNKQSPRKIKH